ncbi:MAG: hypothetical protein DWQ28_10930 [Proteobacteria bacterium]|nr:MAG: hypothetical protein DWQ28_10930 [Pseudomonadota bacterium]
MQRYCIISEPSDDICCNRPTDGTLDHNQPNAQRPTPNAQRPTPNAQRPTPNAQRPTPNANAPKDQSRWPAIENRNKLVGSP